MYAPEITETIGFKQCNNCSAELFDRDKFCRRCGVNQSSRLDSSSGVTGGVTRRTDGFDYETRALADGGTMRRAYSDPLVGIVTRGLSERTLLFRANRWEMRLISALVAVPLWLMIILLSPLDAYVAAKAIARQI